MFEALRLRRQELISLEEIEIHNEVINDACYRTEIQGQSQKVQMHGTDAMSECDGHGSPLSEPSQQSPRHSEKRTLAFAASPTFLPPALAGSRPALPRPLSPPAVLAQTRKYRITEIGKKSSPEFLLGRTLYLLGRSISKCLRGGE